LIRSQISSRYIPYNIILLGWMSFWNYLKSDFKKILNAKSHMNILSLTSISTILGTRYWVVRKVHAAKDLNLINKIKNLNLLRFNFPSKSVRLSGQSYIFSSISSLILNISIRTLLGFSYLYYHVCTYIITYRTYVTISKNQKIFPSILLGFVICYKIKNIRPIFFYLFSSRLEVETIPSKINIFFIFSEYFWYMNEIMIYKKIFHTKV